MPVIDGVFVPRSPLTPAEAHVDYLAHDNHVLDRRRLVEQAALPAALRIVQRATALGDVGNSQRLLAAVLATQLSSTARFGYLQSQLEVSHLRHARPVTAAVVKPPTAPAMHQLIRKGLPGITAYVGRRSALVGDTVVEAVVAALHAASDPLAGVAAARAAAQRALHNGVLELVGATLNLGRSVGVASMPDPPRYAMRSEQLDGNTCGACDEVHGQIVEIDSAEYFDLMPPNLCFGGGRCRGIYVYGDDESDVQAAVSVAA